MILPTGHLQSPREPNLPKNVIAEAKLRSRNNPVARGISNPQRPCHPCGEPAREARAITNESPRTSQVDTISDLDWVQKRRFVFRRPLVRTTHGRLHFWTQSHLVPPRAAWRASRGGLSVNDFIKLMTVQSIRRGSLLPWPTRGFYWLKPRGCFGSCRGPFGTPLHQEVACLSGERNTDILDGLNFKPKAAPPQVASAPARAADEGNTIPSRQSRCASLDFNENTLALFAQGARRLATSSTGGSHALP